MAYVKGINIVIGADTTQLDKAIVEIDRNTKSLNRELKAINTSLKFDPKNTDLLAQKIKILNERYSETQKRLEALKSAQEGMNQAYKNGDIPADEYRRFQSDIKMTESQLKGYEAQLKKVTEQYNHQSSVLGKVSDSLTDFGKKADNLGKKFLPVSTAAAANLGILSKSAMDFESAWAGVTKTVDGTPAQMEKIKNGIREMSKELPSSAVEISKVAEAAGQMGIETDSVLEFTKVIIDMSNSTTLVGDEAANALARFANITQMSQKDFRRLGSSITKLGNNFATTETEIVDMSLRLAAAGTQVGMTEAEIVALAAALSSVGLETQAGGTAFSKLMVQMQLAVETGSAQLQDFSRVAGVSADEFSKAFGENATDAILMFVKGLSKSGEQGESAIKILDDMGIKEVRLRDAILRSTNASDLFTKAIDMSSNAWEENTALTEEASKRYETTESKMAMLKNKLVDVAITLGEKLLPHIQKFAEWLGNLAESFGNVSPEMQEFILKALAITAVSYPLLRGVGALSTGLGSLIGGFGTAGRAMGLLKPASATLTTTLAGTTSAFAGTTTAVGASATGMGGFIASLGGVATAAAPVALAVAGVGLAGYGLYKVITEDANPAVDLFADKMTHATEQVGVYGDAYVQTVEKISEETKTSVGSYIEFTDTMREETANLYVGLTEVTTEGITSLIAQNNQMTDDLLQQARDRSYDERTILHQLFDNNQSISSERGDEILQIVRENYDNQVEETESLRTRLNKIYEEIKLGGVGATLEQKKEIDEILTKMNENAVNILSKNETEQKIILDRLNTYTTRETKETVSEIIKELNKQKDDGIAVAEEEYAEQIRIAENLRKDKSAEAQKAADDIEEAARTMRDNTVMALEELRLNGFDKLSESYQDLDYDFNLTNGSIRNGWDKLWNSNRLDLENARSEFAKTSEAWKNTNFEVKTARVNVPNITNPRGQTVLKYNNGIPYVPYHNLTATLHRGERVLTADENQQLNKQGFLNSMKDKLNNMTSNIVNNVENSEVLNFNLNGTYHIREEADINKVARQLAQQTRILARSGS